jgi:hypothetical protein
MVGAGASEALQQSERVNRRGRLFCRIGRNDTRRASRRGLEE